ncbi:RidA family protein [Sphingomonas koreensis]|nr:RidA family protein [Sphingomonas koreensis]
MSITPIFEPPFPGSDDDRRAIWTMLVDRDIGAYLAEDWSAVADDFSDGFFGVDARGSSDPDQWLPRFDSIEVYRDEWLRQAAATAATVDPAQVRGALHAATTLTRIDITGDLAIAQKKFHGFLPRKDGRADFLNWRTQYICRRQDGRWRITGFVGYMPHQSDVGAPFRVAATAQHRTAGPYTPVVETRPGARILVISGQAPVDADGMVIGTTIEEQARVTLANCRTQLEAAGASLADVFKATVYLTDLGNWATFNGIYRDVMREPYPARTAVQAGLLPGFLVEIEMWATRP